MFCPLFVMVRLSWFILFNGWIDIVIVKFLTIVFLSVYCLLNLAQRAMAQGFAANHLVLIVIIIRLFRSVCLESRWFGPEMLKTLWLMRSPTRRWELCSVWASCTKLSTDVVIFHGISVIAVLQRPKIIFISNFSIKGIKLLPIWKV